MKVLKSLADLLSKPQNHEGNCANFCGLLRKAELYRASKLCTTICYVVKLPFLKFWESIIERFVLNKESPKELPAHTKGMLISKFPHEMIVTSKIPMKFFLDFCPEIFYSFLGASWKLYGFLGTWSNIINKEAYRKPPGSYKKCQGRILYNIFVAILVQKRTPKTLWN